MVEIGPGTGQLTRVLARRCERLLAVELDGRLVRELRERFASAPHVEVREADFLKTPLPETSYKVFANLPFARTSEILRHLSESAHPPEDAFVIVQEGAALRYAGTPYAHETRPSLLLKPWWHVEIARRIPRSGFVPAPPVDAALLWLARRDRPLVPVAERRLYADFVTRLYHRDRPMRECARGVFTHRQLARLARELRFESRARASTLGFDQWLALFRFFARSGAPSVRR